MSTSYALRALLCSRLDGKAPIAYNRADNLSDIDMWGMSTRTSHHIRANDLSWDQDQRQDQGQDQERSHQTLSSRGVLCGRIPSDVSDP